MSKSARSARLLMTVALTGAVHCAAGGSQPDQRGSSGDVFPSSSSSSERAQGSLGPLVDASGGQLGARDGSSPDALPNGACAQSITQTKIQPVLVVFMFDQSGSMGDSVGNGLTKWTAIIPSLEAFFADPKSTGLSASLQFFAQADECTVSEYATPLVAMTPLPNSTVFANAIDPIEPDGDTPTLPALEGALQYATQEQEQTIGAKLAVVLVTDGEPHDSCGSTIANVAAEAQIYASAIPTYVIGIGKSLTNLNTIAAGGGTNQAFLVATANNPDAGSTDQQTELDFENALNSIRTSQSSCNLPLPSPPQGQSLDYTKVNVLYDSMGGSPQTLSYDENCGADGGSAEGWHYDDLQAPTTIVLCSASCNTIQSDVTAQLNIELGCVTSGIPR